MRTARPMQWMKNVLVFAAPGAAGVLDDWPELGATLLAFVAFCLAASGIYFWNDALDVEADRRHPTKRFRPIAAGSSCRSARPRSSARCCSSLACARRRAAPGAGRPSPSSLTYVVATMRLQRVAQARRRRRPRRRSPPGFVLRAAAGAVAVDVPMSNWFVLVHGVRLAVHRHRQALRRAARDRRRAPARCGRRWPTTRSTYLRIVLDVSCGAALISYCLWAFETKELAGTDLAVLRAVDRADADRPAALPAAPRAGHGAAPGGGVRQRPRAAAARAWRGSSMFGLAVYLR